MVPVPEELLEKDVGDLDRGRPWLSGRGVCPAVPGPCLRRRDDCQVKVVVVAQPILEAVVDLLEGEDESVDGGAEMTRRWIQSTLSANMS